MRGFHCQSIRTFHILSFDFTQCTFSPSIHYSRFEHWCCNVLYVLISPSSFGCSTIFTLVILQSFTLCFSSTKKAHSFTRIHILMASNLAFLVLFWFLLAISINHRCKRALYYLVPFIAVIFKPIESIVRTHLWSTEMKTTANNKHGNKAKFY